MALSNIFREPRREITESVVGLAVFAGLAWADYEFALWFHDATGGGTTGCPWPLGLFFGILAGIFVIGIIIGTHALGDEICNALQRRGVHLRPRNRS